MSPQSRLLCWGFLILSIFAVTALSSPANSRAAHGEDKKFQQLLAGVDEGSIHSILHQWSNKFQDGVFSKDRTAMEHVHSEDAPLATKLVQLAKRASNVTTTTITSSSTSKTTTSTSSRTPKPSTTSTMHTTQSTTPSTTPAVVPPSSSSTPSPVTVVTAEPSSATVMVTATLPGGEQSVSTSVTVVGAEVTTVITPTAVAATSGTSSPPHLQKSLAVPHCRSEKLSMAVVAGAIGIVLLA